MQDDDLVGVDSFFVSKEIESIFLEEVESLKDTVTSKIIFDKEKQFFCKVKSYAKKNKNIKIKFFCASDVVVESLMCSNKVAIEFLKENKVFIKYDMNDNKTYNAKIKKAKNDIYILEVEFRSE